MSSRTEGAVSALLVIAALAIAASAVRRTFFPPTGASSGSTRAEFLPSWKEALTLGIRTGDSTAPVTIVEFADLECPSCRGFQSTLRHVMQAHPHGLSVVYVSYLLTMHRFALGAARGALCAYQYGKFREWLDEIYDKQDSLGLKSWGAYALEAGLPDTAAISKCATDPTPVGRIEAGRALGDRFHIPGTPTVIVNGWRLPHPPSEGELTSIVAAIANGRIPFDTS